MTKEITKTIILQEIADKFRLREFEPDLFTFSEMVIPTYDIGKHVQDFIIHRETKSITSAAGFLFFVVPQNERWEIRGYNIVFMTGSYKVSGVYVRRPNSANTVYLDLKEGQTVSYIVNMVRPVILPAGSQISILVDDYTSTGDLRLEIDCMVEEVR